MPRLGRPPKIQSELRQAATMVNLPKAPVGRPSVFEPWMCDVLINTFTEGQFIAGFCVRVGIAERTFYRWVQDHPPLAEAYEVAKTASKAFYEAHLAAQAVSPDKAPNFNQIAMILNNRFKEDYTRNANGNSEGTTNNNTNITVLNLPTDKLEEEIQKLLKMRDIESDSNTAAIEGTYSVIAGETSEGEVSEVLTDVPSDGEVC